MADFNIEAEQAVLGRALVDAQDMAIIADLLRPEFFYREAHRVIFRTMLEIHQACRSVNIITVGDLIEERDQIEAIESTGYLSELVNYSGNQPDYTPIEEYAALIIEKSRKRDTGVLYAKAQAMAMEGYSGQEILSHITEGQAAIDAYGNASSALQKPYAGMTLDDMDALPEMEWYITGILPAHVTAGIFGDAESGKSITALDWTMRTPLGWKWRGREIKQGHVWYIAGEGYQGIRYRMKAWLTQYNVAQEAVSPYVHVVPIGVPLMRPGEVSKLISRIKETPYTDEMPLRAVILDTLSRCMEGGDENDNSDMRDALVQAERIHRETGAAVLVVHHAGKNDQYRGASTFRDNLDTVLKTELKEGKSTLYCEKQKDGAPKFKPIASEIVGVTRPEWEEKELSFPVLIPSEYEPPQETTDIRGNMRVMLLVLGKNRMHFQEWADACAEWGNVKLSSFKERLAKARKQGLVIETEKTYALSDEAMAWFVNNEDGLPGEKKQRDKGNVINIRERMEV